MVSVKHTGYWASRERNLGVYTPARDKGDPTKPKTRVCAKFVLVELQAQNAAIRVQNNTKDLPWF